MINELFSKTQRVILSWSIILIILVFAIGRLHSIKTADETSNYDSITVSGEGKVTIKPDVAVVRASVMTTNRDVKKAQDENTTRANAVVKFLADQKVADKDIKTVEYSISPNYSYDSSRQTLLGYNVTQSLEIKIRDFKNLSDIVDGMVSKGVNQTGGIQFKVDDQKEAEAEARASAIADAKSQARDLAKKLGVRLGKLTSFTENGGNVMYYNDTAMGLGAGESMAKAVPPSLPTGENEIKSNVSLTYRINN